MRLFKMGFVCEIIKYTKYIKVTGYEAVSEVVTSYRKGEKINRTWKQAIETDFEGRSART